MLALGGSKPVPLGAGNVEAVDEDHRETLVKRRAYVPLKGITIQRNKTKTKHHQNA